MTFASIAALLVLTAPAAPAQEASPAPAAAAPTGLLALEPRAGSGVLSISNERAPGETFEFVTCEALVVAGKQLGELYPIKLEPQDWKREGAGWSYSFPLVDKVRLDLRATPEPESCRLEYTLTNGTSETLEQVLIYPCMPTMGATSFYPGSQAEAQPGAAGRKARVGRADYSELFARLSLWSGGERFTFAKSALAPTEKHLAFMKQGETPVDFAWFVNAEHTFDLPVLAVASKDGRQVAGFALDSTVQASSNVGDGRACIHLVPFFRALAPGTSAKATGRFYWMQGGPDDLLARYRRDFATPAAK